MKSRTKCHNIIKTCIYCTQSKSIKLFNREHVIPESFGLFDNTMVLHDCVCRECNQFFGDNLDLYLSRDSVFGILYRGVIGAFDRDKFIKTITKRRERLEFKIHHPDHDFLLVDLDLDAGGNFSARTATQLIVMNSTKGACKHFRPEHIPHRRALEDMGLCPTNKYTQVFICSNNISHNVKLLNTHLEKNNIRIKVLEKQVGTFMFFKEERQPLYFSSLVDQDIQRAVAKIAFNYFAYQYGGSIALSDSFLEIRNFIRHGIRPKHQIFRMENTKIPNNHPLHLQFSNHSINITQEHGNIIAYVNLFNAGHFMVALGRALCVSIPQKAHAFDLINKKIHVICR